MQRACWRSTTYVTCVHTHTFDAASLLASMRKRGRDVTADETTRAENVRLSKLEAGFWKKSGKFEGCFV